MIQNSFISAPTYEPSCANGETVPADFMQFEGKLLHVSRAYRSFKENVRYCHSLGADMFLPNTQEKLEIFRKLLGKHICR